MANITVEGLTKTYSGDDGDVTAVADLDLEVEDGELMILVGPSGCGKTTTLRCIAGLEDVTEGRIVFGGEDITERKSSERDMAMVFQNFALYPHMTAGENMSFGLKLKGERSDEEIDRLVDDVASMLDIEGLLDKYPDQLSGGQKQRIALGRAIVREPEAFLFDEPLSNLDAKLRTKMRTEIQRLQNELAVTSVYVTHDQAEAMTMGDHIAVMKEGKLQQVGTPEAVYHHPRNRFVAGFIGDPSMNFWETELVSEDARTSLRFGDQTYRLSSQLGDSIRSEIETDVTVGVRPEDIRVVDPASESTNVLETEVVVVEPMGDENLIYSTLGGTEFVSKTDPRSKPDAGSTIHVTFDEDDLYLFTPSGEAVKSRTGLESEEILEST